MSDRISDTVEDLRVKLHLFEPSGKKLWTVVGKRDEHWINPDLDFCSCRGFYYNKTCYHLDAIYLALKRNVFDVIRFSDEEFDDFVAALVMDM